MSIGTMALTYTLAGLQTQLDAVADALDSEAWATARASLAKAWLVVQGLPSSTQTDGATMTLRVQDALDAAINAAKEEGQKSGDNRRIIRVGLSRATRGRRV